VPDTEGLTIAMNMPLSNPATELRRHELGEPRRIVVRTRGRQHGPVMRLVSPSDIGELIKPFIFLDHAEVAPRPEPVFGIHPHSGIATLTTVRRGGLNYEDTTTANGKIGSAIKHPHPLVLGYYSVHTSEAGLEKGEAEIRRIGSRLRTRGRR